MARNSGSSERRRAPKETNRKIKKKVCAFCADKSVWVDYKDLGTLRRYMSDRGKIRARRVSGNCAQHQREVAAAIKTARELAMLPYTQRALNERPAGAKAPRRAAIPAAEAEPTTEAVEAEETEEVV